MIARRMREGEIADFGLCRLIGSCACVVKEKQECMIAASLACWLVGRIQ
jgi:hypothetical protein